jgi:hypothetical protein
MVPACMQKVSCSCAHARRFRSTVITISSPKFLSLFLMNTSSQSPSSFWRQTPRGIRVQIVLIGIVAFCLALVCPASGCATTDAGLAREERIYGIATNVVAHAQQIAPSLPTPFNVGSEGILAVLTAALAAWNTVQHREIAKLKTGKMNNNGSAGTVATDSNGSGGSGSKSPSG